MKTFKVRQVFFISLVLLCPFMFVQVCSGQFRSIQVLLSPIRSIYVCFDLLRFTQVHLCLLIFVQALLGPFRSVYQVRLCIFRSVQVRFGLFRSVQVRLGPFRSVQVRLGFLLQCERLELTLSKKNRQAKRKKLVSKNCEIFSSFSRG